MLCHQRGERSTLLVVQLSVFVDITLTTWNESVRSFCPFGGSHVHSARISASNASPIRRFAQAIFVGSDFDRCERMRRSFFHTEPASFRRKPRSPISRGTTPLV